MKAKDTPPPQPAVLPLSTHGCLPSEEDRVRMLRAVVAAADRAFQSATTAASTVHSSAAGEEELSPEEDFASTASSLPPLTESQAESILEGEEAAKVRPPPADSAERLSESEGPKEVAASASADAGRGGDSHGDGDGNGDDAEEEDEDSSSEDPPSRKSSSQTATSDPEVIEARHRARLSAVLREDLPLRAASYLLLPPEAVEDATEAVRAFAASRTEEETEEGGKGESEGRVSEENEDGDDNGEGSDHPLLPSTEASAGCVALLLSSLVLQCCGDESAGAASDGTYDARVRTAVKAACVLALERTVSATFDEVEEGERAEVEPVERPEELEAVPEEGNEVEGGGEVGGDADAARSDGNGDNNVDSNGCDDDDGADGAVTASEDGAKGEEIREEESVDADAKVRKTNPRIRAATRKFECMEKAVASMLLQLLLASPEETHGGHGDEADGGGESSTTKQSSSTSSSSSSHSHKPSKKTVIRAVKIGGAAAVAGTLLAVTGGLAAPGIAAGIAALGITGAAAGTITALTSVTVMATLFGVGGGGLAAYKMKRRTDGLKEFQIRREGHSPRPEADSNEEGEEEDGDDSAKSKPPPPPAVPSSDEVPELRSTLCVSGWLRDKMDYQRPWGVVPTDPPIKRRELLRRFYAVYNPEKVKDVKSILETYKGQEEVLWEELDAEYGRDPDHLLPLSYVDVDMASLSDEESGQLANLLSVVIISAQEQKKHNEKPSKRDKFFKKKAKHVDDADSLQKKVEDTASFFKHKRSEHRSSDKSDEKGSMLQSFRALSVNFDDPADEEENTAPVWDFLSLYGSDLYTITWESSQLSKVCKYMNELAAKAMTTASKEVVKQTATMTAFSAAAMTILTATALPVVILNAANNLDEPWLVLSMRADEAGRELALCLLKAEKRPVTLVGFSFGARVILSCLKELDRHQQIWEERRQGSANKSGSSKIRRKGDSIKYDREPASVVEDAILMGTPEYISKRAWKAARRVVSGRLINCFSRRDWVLSLMFKKKNMMGFYKTPCGVGPIKNVPGVENHDVSNFIPGHSAYLIRVPHILEAIGFSEPIELDDESNSVPVLTT